MSKFNIAVIISVLFSIGAIGFLIYIVRRQEEYTREKFAFAALTTFVTFAGTITTSIIGKESPWAAIYNIIRVFRGLPKEPSESHTTDHILLVLVLWILATFINRIYRDWNGAISSDEHERNIVQAKPILVLDGLSEAKRIILREPRKIYHQGASLSLFSPLDNPSDSLEWHLQAIDLITIRNPSYRFNLDHDYHPEAHCWIGEYPQIRKTVAILCVQQQATDKQIGEFLDYIRCVKGCDLVPEELIAIIAVRYGVVCNTIVHSNVSISSYSEEVLLDDLVDFSDYYDYLASRVEREPLADSDKTLEMVYAPSACIVESTKTVHEDVETVLSTWLLEKGQRQMALLGEYGQGKSTTTLMFAYHLITNSHRRPPFVPIIIELRGRSPRNTTPEGLIAEWAYRFSRIVPKAVIKLIIAGKALVILEGFDEMALAGDAQARYAHFRTLWGFAYPKAKVLFTGRPNYFLDDRELKSALNIEQSSATGPYCESLRLEPFNLDQMKLALRSYPSKTIECIIELAGINPKFREIASRGSLLYVIGELWDRPKGLGQYGSNINSALVIGTFIRSTYERQSSKLRETIITNEPNKRLADFMVLNSSEREFFMSAIAYFMARSRLPNQIESHLLHKVVEKLYQTIPDEISTQVTPSSQEWNTPLRQRMLGAEHVLESIITDVRACGLLVSDPSKPGSFKFAHKSFMEYLVAEVEADKYLQGHYKNIEVLLAPVLDSDSLVFSSTLMRIPEVTAFTAELLLNHLRNRCSEKDLELKLRHMTLRSKSLSKFSMREILLRASAQVFIIFETLGVAKVMFKINELEYETSNFIILFGNEKWALYVVCCAIIGISPHTTINPLERTLVKCAQSWVNDKLPHLAVDKNI